MRSRSVPVRRASGSQSLRAISFSRRRTRFRSTADRPKRGTITPARAPLGSEATAYKSTSLPRRRRPSRRTRRISRVRRTRDERGKLSPGCRAEGSASAAPAFAVKLVTDRQTGASLATTPRQDLASRLGLHAGPEAVVLDPLPVRRLVICRLAHRASSLRQSHAADSYPSRADYFRRNHLECQSGAAADAPRLTVARCGL
jgi:hypothetical protein